MPVELDQGVDENLMRFEVLLTKLGVKNKGKTEGHIINVVANGSDKG